MIRALFRDLGSAWRGLLKRKASSTGAMLILALAIGSNIAIFGVIHSVLLRPLPVRDEDRLVVPQGLQQDTGFNGSLRDLQAWREARSLHAVAGAEVRQVNSTGVDVDPERLNGAAVESSYFEVFGIRPVVGRFFTPRETLSLESKYVILGFALWQRRFGFAPDILGKTIELDGSPHEIVGVLPAGFDMPQQTDLWLASAPDNLPVARQGAHVLPTIARLRPGVSLDEAGAELRGIAERLSADFPDSHAGWGARVIPLRSSVLADPDGRVRRGLLLLFVSGAVLLLIACANFGNILLASSISRSQEIGTRLAIGADRASIGRQFFFEGLLLSFGGAMLSLPAALGATTLLLRESPVPTNAFADTVFVASIDASALTFVACLVTLTGLLAGAVPAFRASRTDVVRLISSSARASDGRSTQRLFEATIVGQIALTLALLIVSSVFVESFRRLSQLRLGFRPEGLVAMDMSLGRRLPVHAQRASFVGRLLEETRALPGVEAAGVTSNTPLTVLAWASRYECEGRPYDPSEVLMASDRLVTEGYLETIGARLVGGRMIARDDRADSPKVAVINEELAERCWPGQDPIGRRVRRISQALSQDWITVVGVVADVRENRQNFRGREPVWYVPYAQWSTARDLRLTIRAQSPASIVVPLRDVMHRLDPAQPMASWANVAGEVDDVLASERLGAVVLAYFSAVSTLLVGLGVYAALAGYVVRQHRSIGMRRAVGARSADVVRLVMVKGLVLMLWGTVVGAIVAFPLSRLMSGLAFDMKPLSWSRVLAAGVALLFLAAVACVVPVRRALRIDPMEALRSG